MIWEDKVCSVQPSISDIAIIIFFDLFRGLKNLEGNFEIVY